LPCAASGPAVASIKPAAIIEARNMTTSLVIFTERFTKPFSWRYHGVP
jgi:hypothetical protein